MTSIKPNPVRRRPPADRPVAQPDGEKSRNTVSLTFLGMYENRWIQMSFDVMLPTRTRIDHHWRHSLSVDIEGSVHESRLKFGKC